jgi:hypothetical protein
VTFHGCVDDEAIKQLFESCRVLCVAATEDFGMVPVEANAAGKLVVGYADGGLLESIDEGVNGTFFHELTEDALLSAIGRADAMERSPTELARCARRFSIEMFRQRVRTVVMAALARKTSRDGIDRVPDAEVRLHPQARPSRGFAVGSTLPVGANHGLPRAADSQPVQ